MLVHDVLRDAATAHGGRPAVRGPDGDRSFAELLDRASRLASGLRALGLRRGDRVLEAIPNGCALIESEFALALAGLVRVPLNPRLGPREWQGIARDSGARALVIDPLIKSADGAAILTHVDVDVVIDAGTSPPAGVASVKDLIAGGDLETDHRADQDDLVALAYSSGTTGRPKGARRTHRMRLASAGAMTTHVLRGTLDSDSLYLHAGPAIHTSGLFTLPMLRAGVPQEMLDDAPSRRIVEVIRDLRVTHLAVVPTVVAALTQIATAQEVPLESVRMLAYAGAPMQTAQLRAAFESLTPHLVQYYGLIEAMPPLSVLTADDHARALTDRPDLLTSAGRVVPSIDLRVDAARGEIGVRGNAVTPGYWNAESRDDLGKAITDGWLETGDLGRVEDGYLWITDRRADVIISGGYSIFPSEVENFVSTATGVAQCAAVGLPDTTWGQRLVVAYQASPGARVTNEDLLEACQPLAPHKRPKEFVAMIEVPLGATGKVDRRAVATRLTLADGAGSPTG